MSSGETTKIRPNIWAYLKPEMNGVDLGSGGDPIMPTAIQVDQPFDKYIIYQQKPGVHNLKGDASDLYWFTNGCLDYVYSSHLLEDFDDKIKVLIEWARVIKPGGWLILYLPDEQKFRAHCLATGQCRNLEHKDKTFSINKMLTIIKEIPCLELVEHYEHQEYNFVMILKKKGVE